VVARTDARIVLVQGRDPRVSLSQCPEMGRLALLHTFVLLALAA